MNSLDLVKQIEIESNSKVKRSNFIRSNYILILVDNSIKIVDITQTSLYVEINESKLSQYYNLIDS